MKLTNYRAWYLEFPPPSGTQHLVHQTFVLRDRQVLTSVTHARLANPFPVFRVCPDLGTGGPPHTEFWLPDQEVQTEQPALDGWVFGMRFSRMIATRVGFSLSGLRCRLATLFVDSNHDFQDSVALAGILEAICQQVLPEITAIGMTVDPSGSDRTKRRHFLRSQGLAPKPFSDIRRFQRALKDVAQSDLPLAQLAQDHDYADQAHLSRDFVRRTGMSPAKFRKSWTGDSHVRFIQETDQKEGIDFGILIE